MSERQDIDRLFQEKFKDFEAAPSDKIWANIQRQMNKEEEEEGKKEPVLLPLWLKVCGVAAVFLIGFSVGNSYLFNPKNKSIDTTDGVASETKSKTETINSTTNSSVLENQLNSQNNNSLVNSEESNNTIVSKKQLNEITASEKTTSSENNIKNSWKGTNLNNPSSQQATASVERKKAVQSSANLKENNTINTTNSVTSVSEKTTITNTGNPSILNNATAEEKIAAANNNGIANTNSDAKNTSELVKENSADLLYQNNKSKVAFEVGKERYSNLSDRGIQAKNPNKSNPVFANNQSAVIVKDEKLLKKSTLPKTLGITTVDSSQLANGKENPLDKLLKEKEEKNKKEDSKATTNSKWVVSSKATPVFMGASGSNSTLDSQFDNNSRNYKTTFSYGMG
ncbi:hypothetical protein, partial [Flavobacterium sp.]|uniref:hypothetical protein n=1 Tax=Flavobacterium sp. TaxID=239 RepID=UPI0028BE96D7